MQTAETPALPAWDDWLQAYAPKLLLYARMLSSCEADAQDALQNAFVNLLRKYQQTPPSCVAIAYASVRHSVYNLTRNNRHRTERESVFSSTYADGAIWFDSSTLESTESKEAVELLEQAIRSLPEDYREVVALKIWGELTFDEIADTTGISRNTIASRYRYALQSLKSRMKACTP